MADKRSMSEEELVQKALDALMSSLGPIETTRFLTLSRTERIESVLRHQQWQDSLDNYAFFNQVFSEEQKRV